jgi:ElaB/YqjD/DUF883 family membrane-anchored ribosome-binding protein
MSTATTLGDEPMTDRVQQKAGDLAGQAQEKAEEAAEQAKSKLRSQLDERTSQVSEQVNQQASDLRAVGQTLREQGKGGPADAAERLAGYAEKVGGYLREKDAAALVNDAEDFARRQPWAIGIGALGVGFVASRFLKASSGRRYAARRDGTPSTHASAPSASLTTPSPAGVYPSPGAPTSTMPLGAPMSPRVGR